MVREAVEADLDALLALYLHLHETALPEDGERLRAAWARILADPDHHLLVYDWDGELVASCACVVVPNLTRSARPYALIENVVTRRDYRRRGCATACLDRARQIAAEAGCYKDHAADRREGRRDAGVLPPRRVRRHGQDGVHPAAGWIAQGNGLFRY